MDTFSMVPASSKLLFGIIPIAIFLLALLGLFGFITYSSKHVRFEVSGQTLRIRGDLYGREMNLSDLNVAAAKAVNLNQDGQFKPTLRTNGIGLPGYRSGWFRLRNQEMALLFITNPNSVVYIPTSKGYSLLLSVPNPEAFLSSIKQHAS
jgi:hypothetical protein